jgi:hypothetical protein
MATSVVVYFMTLFQQLHYTVSMIEWQVNYDELERIWKERVVA